MKAIQIFDPALCCSTGVCGVEVDQTLVQLSADVDWPARRGPVSSASTWPSSPWTLPAMRWCVATWSVPARRRCRWCCSTARWPWRAATRPGPNSPAGWAFRCCRCSRLPVGVAAAVPAADFLKVNAMNFLDKPPRFLFFTGKGGVGKTSIACATALVLAEPGASGCCW
jgi:hypothetical protein